MYFNILRLVVVALASVLITACVSTPNLSGLIPSKADQVTSEQAFSFINEMKVKWESNAFTKFKVLNKNYPEIRLGDEVTLRTQALNKKEKCMLPTTEEQLARKGFKAFWDGQCTDGVPDGLGRDIAISDTHHLEEIAIYKNGKPIKKIWMDYVNGNKVYRYVLDGELLFDKGITAESALLGYKPLAKTLFAKEGVVIRTENSPGLYSSTGITREGVEYHIVKYNHHAWGNNIVAEFLTRDPETHQPKGYGSVHYANGEVKHFKVENGGYSNEVVLPADYISHFDRITKSGKPYLYEADAALSLLTSMEREYLHYSCKSGYEVQGLDQKLAKKICEYKNDFAVAYLADKNKQNSPVSSKDSVEKVPGKTAISKESEPVERKPKISNKIKSTGSCFAVSPDGYLITNHHVIDGSSKIRTKLYDGRLVDTRLVRSSESTDLAVLKIEEATPNYLRIKSSRDTAIGDKVFTIGYPLSSLLGNSAKYSEGVISSKTGLANEDIAYQVSVPIQPGNSGGPLVNENGDVVGVITSTASSLEFLKLTGSMPQNINWAVKSDYVLPLLTTVNQSQVNSSKSGAVKRVEKASCMVLSY